MANNEDHWSKGLRINWKDRRYEKNMDTVKVFSEGWIWDMYYITTSKKYVSSTNGEFGNCPCDSFRTTKPTADGKVPCKHLLVCKEHMEAKPHDRKDYMRHYMQERTKDKQNKVCENLNTVKDDPNSLFKDESFVKKIIEGGDKND